MPERPMSAWQAAKCELAIEEVCQCRCGGKLHGARRPGMAFSPAAYYLLPPDDPHHCEPYRGAHQITFDDLVILDGSDSVREVAAVLGSLVTLPDPDIRPQEAGGAPCSAE